MAKSLHINPDLIKSVKNRKNPPNSISELAVSLGKGDRFALSRAITLVESQHPADKKKAIELFQRCKMPRQAAKRIAITGPPGVGKSTFIDNFGIFLISLGMKPAVLTIDPSSSISGGSILGDKTRMEKLSSSNSAYIRPSPSSGQLGGVAKESFEALLLCEIAGFNPIIIETLGVGQSEIHVREMVDFFVLLLQPGSGDEIQGVKRGILELADLFFVNKADRDNSQQANDTLMAYQDSISLFRNRCPEWTPPVLKGSGLYDQGISGVWDKINQFYSNPAIQDFINLQRQRQEINRFEKYILNYLENWLVNDQSLKKQIDLSKKKIELDEISSLEASINIIQLIEQRLNK